jgi:hypothetical protein
MTEYLRATPRAALAALSLAALPAYSQELPSPLPLKYEGPPTVAEITPRDLMTRIYKFADDSMMGRRVGTRWNDMGTAYIEREVRRLGLKPAGDNGTYFQKIPLVNRRLDSASTITVDSVTYTAGTDFVASANGPHVPLTSAQAVYVGAWLDTTKTLPVSEVQGKILLFSAGGLPPGTNIGEFVASNGYQSWVRMRSAAAAFATVPGDLIPTSSIRAAMASEAPAFMADSIRPSFVVTRTVAEAMLGAAFGNWPPALAGKTVGFDLRFKDTALPGRNVVAILEGTDPALRGQYVAIGAHNDHVGFNQQPADHDSVKIFMQVVRPQGADSEQRQPTADELARIQAMLDSIRAIRPPRPDSIYNGADDDGSGSMTVLEIAEKFALAPEKPKRSILFVWHTGEEAGLWGANYFTAFPTVPRDSIVAQLNMDMVGRGAATDVTGETKEGDLLKGGDGYVQLIGSRRLSTELGDMIEAVNVDRRLGLRFDYAMDANGHPQNIYCRSDHYEYAKFGIPVVFITTGGHADYHQVTDEPQYIQYPHIAKVAELVYQTALSAANLGHRVTVDKPKPDPKGNCTQ